MGWWVVGGWAFSRERLAKGSGLEGNYGRVEVASRGGGCRKSEENPRRIRGESAD